MSQAPAKKKQKEESNNIIIEMLYQVVVYVPVLIISWIVDKFSD